MPCHLAKHKKDINLAGRGCALEGQIFICIQEKKLKRIGNLFDKVCDLDNLRLAHRNAKKGKGWYKEVRDIEQDLDSYLLKLQQMILSGTYRTSEYETFTKFDKDKERLIYKLPYFPDRVCQWAILQVIEPYLLKTFTRDTYSAMPGRGIHSCLKNVEHCMKTDRKGTKFCLKIDARKFYPSINHEILKSQLHRLFKDKRLLALVFEIIDSTEGDTGIPIGNYLSQYCGNLYLSGFDHWIKEEKRVKYYFRYMDDAVIFGNNKDELHRLRKEIDYYFRENLKLTMKENWQVFPSRVRGVDFVGYRCFGNYTLLRKSTCKDMKRKLNKLNKKQRKNQELNFSEFCSVNSYLGWLKHCDSFRLSEKYIIPLEKSLEDYRKGQKKK